MRVNRLRVDEHCSSRIRIFKVGYDYAEEDGQELKHGGTEEVKSGPERAAKCEARLKCGDLSGKEKWRNGGLTRSIKASKP